MKVSLGCILPARIILETVKKTHKVGNSWLEVFKKCNTKTIMDLTIQSLSLINENGIGNDYTHLHLQKDGLWGCFWVHSIRPILLWGIGCGHVVHDRNKVRLCIECGVAMCCCLSCRRPRESVVINPCDGMQC